MPTTPLPRPASSDSPRQPRRNSPDSASLSTSSPRNPHGRLHPFKKAEFAAAIPIRRFGDPSEKSAAVAFLASPVEPPGGSPQRRHRVPAVADAFPRSGLHHRHRPPRRRGHFHLMPSFANEELATVAEDDSTHHGAASKVESGTSAQHLVVGIGATACIDAAYGGFPIDLSRQPIATGVALELRLVCRSDAVDGRVDRVRRYPWRHAPHKVGARRNLRWSCRRDRYAGVTSPRSE